MKEKITCGLSIFFLADMAIMPTEANIPAGYTVNVEPVAFFDYRDKQAFIEALWEAIKTGNPTMENPPMEDLARDAKGFLGFKKPVELKYAKVDTWEDLERASIYASIGVFPSGYIIEVYGRSPEGTWSEERLLETRVRIARGIDTVVDVLLEHLDSRTDLSTSPGQK